MSHQPGSGMYRRDLFIPLIPLLFALASPSPAQVIVAGNPVHEQSAVPGETYTGFIFLENASDTPRTVRLERRPGTGDIDSTYRSNDAWVVIEPPALEISPGETARVTYRMSIPRHIEGATPVGTYWCEILVHEDGHNTPVEPARVELVTHMQEPGRTDVSISDVQWIEDGSERGYVRAAVTNAGHSLIRPATWFEFYDRTGQLQDRIEAPATRIHPGHSVYQYVPVNHLDPGVYEVLVVVDAGGEHIFGAQYTVRWSEQGLALRERPVVRH